MIPPLTQDARTMTEHAGENVGTSETASGSVAPNVRQTGVRLDALVAEKVMGWTVAWYDGSGRHLGYEAGRALYYETADGKDVDGIKRHSLSSDWAYWSPSTDIAAAWSVVESTRTRGVFLDIETLSTQYRVVAARMGTDDEPFWEQGTPFFCEEVAHAICLAALEAVGSPLTQDSQP